MRNSTRPVAGSFAACTWTPAASTSPTFLCVQVRPRPPTRRRYDRAVPRVVGAVTTSLAALRADAAHCTRCELYEPATQTVFGDGPASAWLLLVGEQPGDQEDRAGMPFVGPAGRVLDDVLEHAGIARDEVYVTNAVKHFRFERNGAKRLHRTPTLTHVRACAPWL